MSAVFSMHALLRRMQRGHSVTDDQLLDDMALLAKHDAGEVGIDESFAIRTADDGRWLGRGIRQREGGRALNVRSWLAE